MVLLWRNSTVIANDSNKQMYMQAHFDSTEQEAKTCLGIRLLVTQLNCSEPMSLRITRIIILSLSCKLQSFY